MDLGLKGKRALVTGASAGLGLAAAEALAGEGAALVINSRSEENLKKAASIMQSKTGHKPDFIAGDLSIQGRAEEIARKAIALLGGIDILVSNAGGPPAGKFPQHDRETWDKATTLTLHSAIDLTRALLSGMKERGWGRIIYITSVAVRQPIDNLIISNTLRAGLTGFAKSLSNEMAAFGITVNTVLPGYTDTDRLKVLARTNAEVSGQDIDAIYSGWTSSIPAGRVGRPEELAALIAFLASEKASYITGTAIPVDGGIVKALL
nr:SDR family oxidoreductase [candidate division Zixibacteria bacterium]